MKATGLFEPLGSGRVGLVGVVLTLTVEEALIELAKAQANAADSGNTNWPDLGLYLRAELGEVLPDVTNLEAAGQVVDANHAEGTLRTWSQEVGRQYREGLRPTGGAGTAHHKKQP